MMRSHSADRAVGIDFGTSNTVVAIAGPDGEARAVTFPHGGDLLRVYVSALCFWEESGATRVASGPWAIDQFLDGLAAHRFILSFKSFAASRAFQETRIFRDRYKFEDLLVAFLRTLLRRAGDPDLHLDGNVVIGRPVKFVGSHPDDALAMQRYREAFGRLGAVSGRYVYEPVGAAFYFARQLDGAANVLVADFGGGTSDFSVMRFERRDGRLIARPLGHAGIGIAGDTFDYRIIDKVVSLRLGKDGQYRSLGKILTVPNSYFANFARWHHLAMMKASGELREIASLVRMALDPEPLQRFIDIVENDLGFALYRAVSATKVALSSAAEADFRFNEAGIDIAARVTRREFESWIADDVGRIAETVDLALAEARLGPEGIDRVFLTGGSSFIPAIRDLFAARFGEERLMTADQFESIAYGLALIGRSPDPDQWAIP
jgi:hypothetical chaperone protein